MNFLIFWHKIPFSFFWISQPPGNCLSVMVSPRFTDLHKYLTYVLRIWNASLSFRDMETCRMHYVRTLTSLHINFRAMLNLTSIQYTIGMSQMKMQWFFLQLDISMQVFSAKATTCGPRYTGTSFTLQTFKDTDVGNIAAETTMIAKCLCDLSPPGLCLLKKKSYSYFPHHLIMTVLV